MTATTLNFLANDGAVTATFKPSLSAEQYDELLGIVTGNYGTSQELCDMVRAAAKRWGVECIIDAC